jgi:hypothetical protein
MNAPLGVETRDRVGSIAATSAVSSRLRVQNACDWLVEKMPNIGVSAQKGFH